MPVYEFMSPYGIAVQVQGNRMPTEAEVNAIFDQIAKKPAAPVDYKGYDPDSLKSAGVTPEEADRLNRQGELIAEQETIRRGSQQKTEPGGVLTQLKIGAQQAGPAVSEQANAAIAGSLQPSVPSFTGAKMSVASMLMFGPLAPLLSLMNQPKAVKAVQEQFQGAANIAREAKENLETVGRATQGPDLARQAASTVLASAPVIAAAPAGFPGMIAASGLQSFGATYNEAQAGWKAQGKTDEEAKTLAAQDALVSGFTAAIVTAGFGKTGVEAFNNPAAKQGVKAAVGNLLQQVGLEATEEATDQVFQDLYAKARAQPDLTPKDIARDVLTAYGLGGIAGGVVNLPRASVEAIKLRAAGAPATANAVQEIGSDSGPKLDTTMPSAGVPTEPLPELAPTTPQTTVAPENVAVATDPATEAPVLSTAAPDQPTGETPPGITTIGPTQERIEKASQSALGDYQYVAQTEKARADYAVKLADNHGDNFQGAYDEMVRIDDTAFQSVVASELLSRQLEKFANANPAEKLELERNIRLLTPRVLNQKTESGQALQAQKQVNDRLAPYAAFLSYMDLVRKRLGNDASLVDDPVAQELQKLGKEAEGLPEGIRRNRAYQKMVDLLHQEVAQGKIDANDLLRDVWYGSVLSRGGTMLNVAIGSLTSGLAFSFSAAADRLARGHPREALDILGRFLSGVQEGAQMFGPIVSKGDYTMLPDYSERAQRILEGKGRHDSLEALWKKGGATGIFPGGLAFTRRLMTALDYIGAQGTEDATLLYSALTRDDQDSIQSLMKRHDAAASKAAEDQAKAELGADAKRIEIIKRKKEILEEGVSKEVRDNAIEIARRAAANADPRGIPGAVYRMFEKAPWWGKAITGLGFLRAAMNMVGNASNMFPGLGAVTYARARLFDKLPEGHPFKKFGLDLPIEQQRMVGAMQVLSLAATGALAGLFLPDDEDRQLEISGSWLGLSADKKRALQDAGEKPNSVRFGKNKPWLSYRQLGFAGPMAIIGNMRDAQRFRGEKWDEESAMRKIVNGWLSGAAYIKDISTLAGLTEVFGGGAGDTRPALEDMAGKFNRVAADTVGRFGSGYVPSALKEADEFSYNYLFRPDKESALDYWIRNLPVVRQLQGEGPALNLFGEPVELDRPPTRSWLGGGNKSDLLQTIASKMEQGVFPPHAGATAKVSGVDGNLRRMTSKEAYEYQRQHGRLFKSIMEENVAEFQKMPPDEAQKFYEKIAPRISEAAKGTVQK